MAKAPAGAAPAAPATPSGLRRALPWLGIGIGLWAAVPPYAGPELANLKSSVEIVDHIVPSIALLAAALATLALDRRAGDRAVEGSGPLVAGLTVALAGLWMTATHLPLVSQLRRGEGGVTGVATAWHTTPGVVVLLLGLVWVATTWGAAGDEPAPAAKAATKPAARKGSARS